MLFRLLFLWRSFHHLLGGLGRNGKVYFSAVDVGHILGEPNAYSWAESVASCQWIDIFPGCNPLLASGWVIEQHALHALLKLRLLTSHSTRIANDLLNVLTQTHFREVSKVHEVMQLEECAVHVGKPFPAWRNEFRMFVFQPPQLDLRLPYYPFP